MLRKFMLSAAGSLAIVFAMPLSTAAIPNTVVTPTNTQGWSTADTRPGGAVNFINDATTPAGVGALQLTTNGTTTAKAQYLHSANTALSQVNTLSYQTKQVSAAFNGGAPSYQLPVYLDGTPASFTTLVYEPYENGTVSNNTWQTWAVDQGQFWSSRSYSVPATSCSVTAGGGGAPFYSLSDLKANCPDAVVIGFGVNVGSNNPSYNVETDLFNFNGTVYDFETDQGPIYISQCKDNGYKIFTAFSFKNQHECAHYARQHNYRAYGEIRYDAYGLQRHAYFHMNRAGNRGLFKYSDKNGDSYSVKIQSVSISSDGKTAYFAGPVTETDHNGHGWTGLWLFGKAQDHQNPNNLNDPDQIWGSFTDQTTALNGVKNQTSPNDGPFSVQKGNLVVKQTDTSNHKQADSED